MQQIHSAEKQKLTQWYKATIFQLKLICKKVEWYLPGAEARVRKKKNRRGGRCTTSRDDDLDRLAGTTDGLDVAQEESGCPGEYPPVY